MDIIALTRQLGRAIQEDELYLNYLKAKADNDADEALQAAIGEFNLQRLKLNEELSSENKDEEKVKSLNADLRRAYAAVMVNPSMQAYNEAKEAFDAMINQVTGIISMCVNGEDPDACDPSACTGSCSTCGGCH